MLLCTSYIGPNPDRDVRVIYDDSDPHQYRKITVHLLALVLTSITLTVKSRFWLGHSQNYIRIVSIKSKPSERTDHDTMPINNIYDPFGPTMTNLPWVVLSRLSYLNPQFFTTELAFFHLLSINQSNLAGLAHARNLCVEWWPMMLVSIAFLCLCSRYLYYQEPPIL